MIFAVHKPRWRIPAGSSAQSETGGDFLYQNHDVRVRAAYSTPFCWTCVGDARRLPGHFVLFAGVIQKNFEKFIKRHHFLKYEIRKFQNSISHFYEALAICQSEQQGLKKELKNSIHEASVFKTIANEYAYRVEDIYTFIQSAKNDKINKNIYLLTLISALFLPLNFITGFFGMNTNGMFLSSF